MKIIKEGNIPSPNKLWWVGKRFSCKGGCGCVFEMEEGDSDATSDIFSHTCPACKRNLMIVRPGSIKKQKAIFEEIFGKGGMFEKLFGK